MIYVNALDCPARGKLRILRHLRSYTRTLPASSAPADFVFCLISAALFKHGFNYAPHSKQWLYWGRLRRNIARDLHWCLPFNNVADNLPQIG